VLERRNEAHFAIPDVSELFGGVLEHVMYHGYRDCGGDGQDHGDGASGTPQVLPTEGTMELEIKLAF
jgi:hypothetical protein